MKAANFAPTYCALYPELAEIARKHGYALAIHGSMARDFDLICVPWVDRPSEPDTVIDEIVSTFAIRRVGGLPSAKPHGRMAHTISVSFGECAIDLSFMPRLGVPDSGSVDARRRVANWLRGLDTGVSSETMAAIYLGADSGDFDAPHDPYDFGRCYRLLIVVPEVRSAFPRITALVPEFAGILRDWESLCVIYDRDRPSGVSQELYGRIKSLRAESAAAAAKVA